MIGFLTTWLIGMLIFGVIWLIIDWLVHISMVRDSCHTYGWAGFKKFREHFDKTEWVYENDIYGEGLFGVTGRYQKDKYFASIIKFDDIGMIINNPISSLLVKLYVKGYIQKNHSREVGKKKKNYKW